MSKNEDGNFKAGPAFWQALVHKMARKATAPLDAELAAVEVRRRTQKGCKNPSTQALLVEALAAYEAGTSVPRKKARKAHKPAQKSAPIYAEVAEISHREMDAILVMESEDSLATTFTPAA